MQLVTFYILTMCMVMITFISSILLKNTELKKRSLTLLLLINIISLIIFLGQKPFMIFILIIAVVGAIEITGLSSARFGKVAMTVITVLILFIIIKLYGYSVWYLLPILTLTFVVLLLFMLRDINSTVLSWVCLIAVIIPGCVALSDLFDISYVHIIAIILFAQFNDGFSYLIGKKMGKTRLRYINTISPNKTLEGYMGGLLGILLCLVLLNTIIPVYPKENLIQRSVVQLFSVFVFANIGDLAFSSIKRRLGIKDFSNILAGHGGVLDRFDSILFLAPVYLFLLLGGII